MVFLQSQEKNKALHIIFKLAKEFSLKIDNVVLGILAIVAGVLILSGWLPIAVVVAVFLIVYGIATLIKK
jgi:hypothetical protein